MAAPCDQWNSRELIPPPTNFPSINATTLKDGEHSHRCDCLKSTLQSIHNGKDLNGSLLKGEQITLSRFLYKNKNSQRSWKLYGLLVKLKKCLERLAETTIHSYAGTMLSAWDGPLESSTPITNLPSRQMLEYLCVSLQGCAQLCVYLATLCEQAALIMIDTVHSGMFLSSNLVFLAIVSRVRVLICNFFKSTVGWYDSAISGRSSLPSTNAEWLRKETQLPPSLMDWLGEEAARLIVDVTSSKTAADQSLLDRLFNTSQETSLEVSMDTGDGGEGKVTAVNQLPANTPASIPDLGEKLSRADMAILVTARSKQVYNQLNPQVSPRNEDQVSKRWKANARTTSPPRKRRRTKDSGSWRQAEEGQPLQNRSRNRKQKMKAKVLSSKRLWHMKKWNIGPAPRYDHLTDNVFTASSKKRKGSRVRQKAEGMASSIPTTVTCKVSRRNSVASQRIGSASRFRRSLSQESTTSYHSGASQDPEKGKRLQQRITTVQERRQRRMSVDKTSGCNSLVIRNSAVSFTPRSALRTAASSTQYVENGSCRDPMTLSSSYSIMQPSAQVMESHSNSHYRGRNIVYPEPTRHKPKDQGLPDTAFLPGGYEPCKAITGFTSKPAGKVSLSVVEPKLTKKKKLVKRLKKLKHKFSGKRRAKGSLPNVPDNSLHYPNQMNISQSSQKGIPQHQPYILPQHADQYQNHRPVSKQQHHHHGNEQQPHHHGNKYQHHQGTNQQYHHQDNNRRYHVDHDEHHSYQQVHAQQTRTNPKHSLSHQMFKEKRQSSHHTHLPKQGGVSKQNKGNKKDKGNTDQDMDSIFSSLL